MQRSSESIAKLAAALAKAQIELVNPKRSLVGTIYPEDGGQERRTFNYASLASGLEIVRKTLGQHEIATVQTTAIDEAAQIVKLTTLLAHSSGEWISSDWPVCAVAETATPQRMGMALTYARRNSLFALVGIAGEDDLDAPDLVTPTGQGAGPQRSRHPGSSHLNGERRHPLKSPPSRRENRKSPKPARPILGETASAELRDRLLAEIKDIGCGDDAALWAYCNLSAKNDLDAVDAECVESAFQAALATFAQPVEKAEQLLPSPQTDTGKSKKRQRSSVIDKSVLTFPEPRRVRDRDHVKRVAMQACLICGRRPSDAHHLRFAQSRGLGRKVSDEFTVPLCRSHHRELHRHGDEVAWWTKARVDPTPVARALWLETHPLPTSSEKAGDIFVDSIASP